ncbi:MULTISPECIES: MFS transporter [unclassified Solwaraspora]|uniref:MFS transporter n=1 Tax=unclassified Solwaraspora TaxID=2627926 RepID=UPI00248D340B|nr:MULTISPECIES: MFS transporter [unclassified Solwaraspora]WBB96671.1 MFS transporter [Solwaraspora sp. WMMA2059]WBC19425.1 MFS transporter [Solwaraspora sp. WMMA2080]WJK32992.1 MFS transporter [Solwaraspora sp. WMMA2065]
MADSGVPRDRPGTGLPARWPRRELAAATVGSVVESYDWTVYGVLAPYFAEQLFPGSSPTTRLIAAYLGFALGFLVRPLGSIVIGWFADTRGRRFGLTLSVTLVAVGSAVIAVAPTYAQVGVAATLLVVLARLVQGLSVGGENPSAAAYVTETAPGRRRFLFSAVSYGGIVIGSALSLAVLAVLLRLYGSDGVTAGAWRIAFALGALLGLIALWIRLGVAETGVFVAATADAAAGARPGRLRLLRAHRREIAVVFLVTAGATVVFYFCTVYLPVYADEAAGVPREQTATALLIGMVGLLGAMVVAGALADRYGGLPVLRIGFAGLGLLSVPLLAGLVTGQVPVLVVALVLLALLGLPLAVNNVFVGELFPPAIRTLAIGLPAAAAISLFGGTFPMLAELLRDNGRVGWVPWLVALMATGALLASWGVRERGLPGDRPHQQPSLARSG